MLTGQLACVITLNKCGNKRKMSDKSRDCISPVSVQLCCVLVHLIYLCTCIKSEDLQLCMHHAYTCNAKIHATYILSAFRGLPSFAFLCMYAYLLKYSLIESSMVFSFPRRNFSTASRRPNFIVTQLSQFLS